MGPTGRMWWSDGKVYEGDFHNNRKHGDGTLEWPDGRMYSGQWHHGLQHGTATARTLEGHSCLSQWRHGVFIQWLREAMLSESQHFMEHQNDALTSGLPTLADPGYDVPIVGPQKLHDPMAEKKTLLA